MIDRRPPPLLTFLMPAFSLLFGLAGLGMGWQIWQAAQNHNFPVILGFTVYESFESDAVAASGIVPMPGAGEQHSQRTAGHAILSSRT